LLLSCRLAGSEAGSGELLCVPASDDPLACLQQQQDPSDLSLHNPAALDYLDHRLMVTDDVRALLAVLAPWLAGQQPFLLVRSLALLTCQTLCCVPDSVGTMSLVWAFITLRAFGDSLPYDLQCCVCCASAS
jgi:hypothetical protein